MSKSKIQYYYKGISLIDYCKQHNLNIYTIRNRISRLKKAHPSKSTDEIITMAVEYKNLKNKYYYKNMLLIEYCKKNNLNYTTIKSRIMRLTEKNPGKNIEEIIELAITYQNDYFFYDGMPLSEYCKLNNLNIYTIKSRIRIFRDKNPNVNINQIIEKAIKYENNNDHYFYNGMTLLKYCKLNNLNFSTINNRIRRLKKDYPEKNIDEIVEMAINFKNRVKKNYYNNMPLSEYCKLNDLCYSTIESRIQKFKKKYPKKNTDEIVNLAVNYETQPIKYYYKDLPLVEYCKLNNLVYSKIRTRLYRLITEYPDKSINEIIEMAINFENKNIKYYYNGKTFKQYCEENGIDYAFVLRRIRNLKKTNPNKTFEELFNIALDKNNWDVKYYYNEQTLRKWCVDNNISYGTIYARIFRKNKKGIEIELDKILQDYNDKNVRMKVIGILNNESYISKEELKEACSFINISYKNVNELIKKKFSTKDAVNIVYFFGELNDNNEKIVSKKMLNYIKNFSNLIEQNLLDREWIDDNLLVLYKLYKCNLYDSRIIFVNHFKNYIYGLIHKTFDRFRIIEREEKIRDVYNELNLKLLELLNRCYTLNKLQMIKYIIVSLKFYCTDYCYNNFLNKEKSLDYYDSDKSNLYNCLDSNKNDLALDEEIVMSIDGYFSESLKNAINDLDKNSLIFVKLKYILQYDNLLIADYLNLNVEEVDKIEESVLNYLRSKPEVVSLIYKK